MSSFVSRALLRAATYGLGSAAIAATGGVVASTAMILTYWARPKSIRSSCLITTAKCSCRPPPNFNIKEEVDLETRLENHYEYGHLTEIYELLNQNPDTSNDPKLLFHLARATYKLSLASPLSGRQRALNDEALLYIGKAMQLKISDPILKANLHSLYAIVLHNKGKKKEDTERVKYLEAAEQHLTAALKEDKQNFLANFALAEIHFEKAKTVNAEVKRPTFAFSFFSSEDSQSKQDPEESKETWRSVSRFARRAVTVNPTDIQSINLMAQSKYALGDLAEAKKFTVMAQNRSSVARFADEKAAARQSRELMQKINEELEKRSK